MKSRDTGKYRVCKQQIGIGGTRQVISVHTSKQKMLNAFAQITQQPDWEYYCEREVIYFGTQFDQNGNPIESDPNWIRCSCK